MNKKEETKNTYNTTSGGIGFTGLLTILFIGLKLTGHISWSWLWVLSPLWISFIVTIIILVLVGVGWGIYKWLN